ncbi:hypothetical protein OF83DRAFT_238375 [Amylostereum chailletii]|nr:hypothetical protein OF83DRAFT_238375 [Amylostereum chailletii]
MPSIVTHLDRAIEIVHGAIEEDIYQNYPEAYERYQTALDLFRLVLEHEQNEKIPNQQLIRNKIAQFTARAEMLRELLARRPDGVLSPRQMGSVTLRKLMDLCKT